ncbi:hypothetical protein GWI33_015143 [Rhynchophorus ferrugineus]|uniref:Uncharacterized protein n=1 Tax=Rhynchophorus ferrugineus TaxID=354439 RepID=A0A834I005_RHYFE|nr:hypothetical protein GWI33_015143 [Rhynchophorus ferrugineus]
MKQVVLEGNDYIKVKGFNYWKRNPVARRSRRDPRPTATRSNELVNCSSILIAFLISHRHNLNKAVDEKKTSIDANDAFRDVPNGDEYLRASEAAEKSERGTEGRWRRRGADGNGRTASIWIMPETQVDPLEEMT